MTDPEQTPATQDDDWVTVAVVLKPHGLKGTFRLKALTREPEELLDAPVREFRVRRGKRVTPEVLRLESGRVVKGILQAKVDGVSDRTEAEKYVGCELVIPESARWGLPEGTYYVDELAGLEVYDAAGGERLGVVKSAQEGPAHDYLVLDLEGQKGETLLPIHPNFVSKIDTAGRRVEVTIPEGLLD